MTVTPVQSRENTRSGIGTQPVIHPGESLRIVVALTPGERVEEPPIPVGGISAEPVPAAEKPKPTPLIRLLMPVIVIAVMGAMVAFLVMSSDRINPMMLAFPLMMGMGLLMSFMPQQGEDMNETRRTYLRHLGQLRQKVATNATEQRRCEWHRHPAPSDLWSLCEGERLWERGPADDDALAIRIGTGLTALCTPIEVPDSGATEDLDPVCAVSLRRAVRDVGHVADMPVVVQIDAFRFLSVSGDNAPAMVRAMLAQLVFHHGPESVGIAVRTEPGRRSVRLDPHRSPGSEWDWLKWLPHTREVDQAAHRILIVDRMHTVGTEEFIDDDYWTIILEIHDGQPGSGTALAMITAQEGLALDADETLTVLTETGDEELGLPDLLDIDHATVLARRLAPCARPEPDDEHSTDHRHVDLRDVVSLQGLPPINRLHPKNMWPIRHPMGTQGDTRLSVALGVTVPDTGRSEIIKVDLKESAHGGMGPHGLCVGATGSGKSELLRTLVTGLVATHSPDELNFVLVDFKGGATFLGLDNLPHTSAVITNLSDEAVLVERMHGALSGELHRRQEALRRAGNFANVTEYENARTTKPECAHLEPMPALVVIIDEFSELLGQHPDFADLFVALGRLGRSLHVHLLLASQRLEEGRLRGLDSHLSYRIGLRTFSGGESRQVLGIPDAHSLPSKPGAGYLKSDAGSPVRFQAGYVSGPLRIPVEDEDGGTSAGGAEEGGQVQLFESWNHHGIATHKDISAGEHSRYRDDPRGRSQLDAVVLLAQETATERGQRARAIWLPPLPKHIDLAGVAEKGDRLTAAIGIIDRPYHQRQDPLRIDLTRSGGHVAVCGGPRSGKTTFLRSLVASLAATHITDDMAFYVIDFGGELRHLERLPHVAGVAGRKEPEKIRRIVDEISTMIDDGVSDRDIALIVDGWQALTVDFEDLVAPVTRIAADGPASRIHLFATTPRWSAMRPAIRDLIGTRLEMRLGEAMDSLIDRKAQQRLPEAPGRGLTSEGEQMLVALSSTQDIAHIADSAHKAGQKPVPQLKSLPASISRTELTTGAGVETEVPRNAIPIGVGGVRMTGQSWNPVISPHLLCVGSRGAGKTTLLQTILAGISEKDRDEARIVLIDHRRSHLGEVDENMVAAYSATTQATSAVIADTVATLRDRLPSAGITATELKERSWWKGPEIYLVIDDLDLVADHELAAVSELLPHARDIGLHLVVARKSGGAGRAIFQPFLSALKDQTPAVLLMDCDRDEGQIFGMKPATRSIGRGALSVDGELVGIIQVAHVGAAFNPEGDTAA